MKIQLVIPEHFSVPGVIIKAFVSLADATKECIELTNVMLSDHGGAADANSETWQDRVAQLQDYHGAAHCYVDLIETDLIGVEAV
jgi:hypothetical protein